MWSSRVPGTALLIGLLISGCRREQRHDLPAHGVRSLPVAAAGPTDQGITWREALRRPEGRIDRRTLRGQRDLILRRVMDAGDLSVIPLYDSVLDLDYDGFDDYLIGYYGSSGTGIKNRVYVYRYHPALHRYLPDSVLSGLANPSFFLDRKRITGFYLGLGGGGGAMLEWKRGRWRTTREFRVRNDDSATRWTISFPGSGKPDSVVRAPYRMMPPGMVMETDLHTLPYH